MCQLNRLGRRLLIPTAADSRRRRAARGFGGAFPFRSKFAALRRSPGLARVIGLVPGLGRRQCRLRHGTRTILLQLAAQATGIFLGSPPSLAHLAFFADDRSQLRFRLGRDEGGKLQQLAIVASPASAASKRRSSSAWKDEYAAKRRNSSRRARSRASGLTMTGIGLPSIARANSHASLGGSSA